MCIKYFLRFPWFAIISAVISFESLHAQIFDPKRYDSATIHSEVRVGVRYTSDYYYMGRSDSAAAPYLSPSIGYFHRSGFFVRSSLSYLTSSGESRVDLIVMNGGYDYYGGNFTAGASVSEYFFSDLSYNVQAEMKTYFNGYVGYDLSGFILYVDGTLGFSDGTDVFVGGELSRTFYAYRNRLRITPGLYINAGTQKYYDAFYTRRSVSTGAGKGKRHGQQPQTQQLNIVHAEAFELLDYETEIQVSYVLGKVRLYSLATWTFPVNPATVVSNNDFYKEKLKNGFFWSSGIRVSLSK